MIVGWFKNNFLLINSKKMHDQPAQQVLQLGVCNTCVEGSTWPQGKSMHRLVGLHWSNWSYQSFCKDEVTGSIATPPRI